MTVGINPGSTSLSSLGSATYLSGTPPHLYNLFLYDTNKHGMDELEEYWLEHAAKEKASLSIERADNLGDEASMFSEQKRWAQHALDRSLSSHPLLPIEDAALGAIKLSERVATIEKITDSKECATEARILLTIPAMNPKHPDFDKLANLQMSSVLACQPDFDMYERYLILTNISKETSKALETSLAIEISDERKRLLKTPEVKDVLLADKIFTDANSKIKANNGNRSGFLKQAEIIEKLVGFYPSTKAGRRAATMLRELREKVRKQ